jgi:dipeptidase E
MRLYLSSFRLGTAPEHLVRLVGTGARMAVIANAIDSQPADVRANRVQDEVDALTRLGLTAEEVDLRHYFHTDPEGVATHLASFDGLWVRGGNVFTLRAALAASSADHAIRALLAQDALVYAGYSAGPCVLGPSLEGLERLDDPLDAVTAYGVDAPTDGLGVLDQRVVPHLGGDHPEGQALAAVAEEFRQAGLPYLFLADGQALLVDGEASLIVGHPATVEELLYENQRSAAPSSEC